MELKLIDTGISSASTGYMLLNGSTPGTAITLQSIRALKPCPLNSRRV